MFIQPISNIQTLEQIQGKGMSPQGGGNQIPFKDMFESAIGNVKDTAAVASQELTKVVSGESDDLHNLNIAGTKYSLAVNTVIEIRNKSLEAYNEIMRMNV